MIYICPWFHFCEGGVINPQNDIGNASHFETNCVRSFLFSEVLTKVKPRTCRHYGYGPDLKKYIQDVNRVDGGRLVSYEGPIEGDRKAMEKIDRGNDSLRSDHTMIYRAGSQCDGPLFGVPRERPVDQ
jgi:hypothetical protein